MTFSGGGRKRKGINQHNISVSCKSSILVQRLEFCQEDFRICIGSSGLLYFQIVIHIQSPHALFSFFQLIRKSTSSMYVFFAASTHEVDILAVSLRLDQNPDVLCSWETGDIKN